MAVADEAAAQAALEKLAAPDRAVGAVAGAVECHADHAFVVRASGIDETGRDVRVVVLHAYCPQARLGKL